MIYKALIIFCVLAVAAGFIIWDQKRTPPAIIHITSPVQDITSDAVIPDASFSDMNEKKHNLYDFKGKIIILNFWASWCAPCVVEFPDLLELAEHHKENVIFIALSVDEDPKNIQKFIQKLPPKSQKQINNANVIVAHDVDKKISQDLFQTVLYPETFIITKDLKIDKKVVGIIEWLKDDMQDYLETLK